jgi:hypothetical protein
MPTALSQRAPRPISGWIEAGLYVFAIAVLSVVYVVGHRAGAHPVAFILYAMAVSAVALLSFTGPGPDALRIILTPQSWLVGAGIIAVEVFYYILLENVAPAHGNLLVRLSIPLSLVLGWALFARRPRPLAIVGALLVCAGVLPLLFSVEPQHRTTSAAVAIASALSFNLRSFASEFHPYNRRARTAMEKLRVTGLVVLVTSVASLALAATLRALIAAAVLPPTRLIPTAAQMLHGPTLLLGMFVGGSLLTIMAALSFSSVVKITTENFTATSAFTPVATLLVQSGASALGLIPDYTLDRNILPAMAVVVYGVLLILVAARRR